MKKFSFKGIKFYSGSYNQIKDEFDKGGVLVAPATSALANIDNDKEYYFACLCCGKNANANVPIDGQEPIMKPSAADNAAGNAAGKGVELTSIAGQKNDDYENPMNAAVAASEDIQVFKDLRQRLSTRFFSGKDTGKISTK